MSSRDVSEDLNEAYIKLESKMKASENKGEVLIVAKKMHQLIRDVCPSSNISEVMPSNSYVSCTEASFRMHDQDDELVNAKIAEPSIGPVAHPR